MRIYPSGDIVRPGTRITPGRYVIPPDIELPWYREWRLEITPDDIRNFSSLDEAMDFVYRELPFSVLRAL